MPIRFCLAALLALIPFSSALATNSNVVGPDVKSGVTQLEARFGFDHDDNRADTYNQRFHADYGLNDAWGVRLITKQRQQHGDNLEYRATDFEVKYQIFEDQIAGFDGGFKAVYSLADGDKKPDNASLFWLYNYSNDRWNLRHNTVLSHQVGNGAQDGLGLELRWQAKAKILTHHALGMEMFNQFGRLNNQSGYNGQSHRIGPVLTGKLTDDVAYQAGLLVGISDNAPDHGLKFFISHSF